MASKILTSGPGTCMVVSDVQHLMNEGGCEGGVVLGKFLQSLRVSHTADTEVAVTDKIHLLCL